MSKMLICAALLSGSIVGAASAQNQLMTVQGFGGSTGSVSLIDAETGVVTNQDWITDAFAVGWDFFTPKKAIHVGDEVWVADQVRNVIHRFELDENDPINTTPQFVGSISGDGVNNFSNLRGLAYDGVRVYLCNNSGFFANSIVVIDPATQSVVSSFPVSSGPFDVNVYGDDLLVVSSGAPQVVRYSKAGVNLGVIVQSGMSTPQGAYVIDGDEFWVSNSLGTERGYRRYNAAGALLEDFVTVPFLGTTSASTRGVGVLNNGDLLLSTQAGLYRRADDGSGGFTLLPLIPGSLYNGQFVSLLDLDGTTPVCRPDLNGDGVVDADDFFLFLQFFAAGDSRADFNGDGVIDADDFFLFLNLFAAGC